MLLDAWCLHHVTFVFRIMLTVSFIIWLFRLTHDATIMKLIKCWWKLIPKITQNIKSLLARTCPQRNIFAIFQENYYVEIYGSLKKFYFRDEYNAKKKNNLILKFKVRVNFVTGSLHVFSSKSKVCGIHLWQLWTNFSFHPVPAGWQKCACSLSSRFSLIIALVLMALADYVAYARRGSFHRFDTICSISSSFLLWTRRATKRLREPRHPFCLAISAVSIIQRETFTVVPSIMKIQNDTGNFLAGFLAVLSVYFSRLRNIRFLTIFGKIYVHISLSGEIFSNSSVLRLTSLFIDVLFCL